MATATAKKSEAATAPPAIGHMQAEAATPATMLEKAITSGANVEVMEKLLALQERWEANQARKAFDTALADLRNDLPAIMKTKAANFGQGRAAYKYEDLSEMIDQLSPALSQHGLSFRWRTESTAPDSVTVTCILSHRDGHSESTSLTAKHDTSGGKNSIQAIGSVVTYLQRYTLKAAVGIAAAVDDDAMSASGETMPHFRQAARDPAHPVTAQPRFISEPQRQRLYGIVTKKGITTEAIKNYLGGFGFQSSGEITRDKYDEIVKWAEAWDALNEFANDARDDDIPDFKAPA